MEEAGSWQSISCYLYYFVGKGWPRITSSIIFQYSAGHEISVQEILPELKLWSQLGGIYIWWAGGSRGRIGMLERNQLSCGTLGILSRVGDPRPWRQFTHSGEELMQKSWSRARMWRTETEMGWKWCPSRGKGGKIRDWLAGLFQEYNGTASSWMGKNRQRILDNEAGKDGRLL